MKKVVFFLAIIGLVLSFLSCGNKKKKEDIGTHTHSDGTVHRDDEDNHDAKPNQESFEVKIDGDTEYGDNDGDEHEPGDGHEHDGTHSHEEGTVHSDHK